MSDGIRYPDRESGGSAGFAAVRAKHGAEMVTRMQNWPKLAKVYCLAQNGDPEMVADEVKKAERELQRVRSDKDYALDQADRIVRKIPSEQEWTVVPSVSQLRREWGMDEPIGMVRLTDLPPVRTQTPAPQPIELNESEVRLKREAAVIAARKLGEAV